LTCIRATSSRPDCLSSTSSSSPHGRIFDEQERAALAWAEVVTRLGDHGVPDSAFQAAAAVFGEKQLADLTIAIGLMNAYNRMAISFRATPMALAA
jgi:alkylhydroperoxidase family enzyme